VFPRAAVVRIAAFAALLLAGGCAATAPRHALPSPTEISGLERRLAADAADADARIRIGIAYRDVGRLEEALTTLEAAASGPRPHPAAVFFLGTVYEEMERFDEARARYEEYLLPGAGCIVQGRLDGDDEQVRLQAAVVDVLGAIDAPTVREQDALRALFEVQKRFALAIYRSLGVELTPAELARIEQRPTADLQALLEYGRGLLAEDRGDFGAAADHFRRAARIDPTFQIAREQAAASRSLAASASLGPGAFGTLAMGELALPLGEINAAQILVPPIRGRDPVPEVLGVEGVGRTLILDIVIRRPQ
jgi:tetratricopeptide (TPR) repeat protein